ncbi:MAG: hypothetical protein Kow0077_14890 [Anaerolineae bacterium]
MRFPPVEGRNLQGRRFRLPEDFGGTYNIVLIAFQRYHQADVESWLPLLKRLRREYADLHIYELPTLWEMPPLRRLMLDMGMRMGIPDRATREMTITLYLDKAQFRQSLEIPTENEIVVLMVDRAGRVLWRTSGGYNAAKGAALAASVALLPLQTA